MAHSPKPYYKPARRTWYVEIARVQHALGKHPDGSPEPKKGKNGWDPPEPIRAEFHRKMAELSRDGSAGQPARPQAAPEHPYVATLLDDFAGWLRKRVEEGTKERRTLQWYERYLNSFLAYLASLEPERPEVPSITADRLRPEHVYGWVDSEGGWKTGRRGAIIAVQRAFTWAARAGKLASLGGRSPLAGAEKPRQGRRELVLTPVEFAAALAAVPDQEFRDLLVAAWETGARPNELFTAEASFLDRGNARWVFPLRRSKGRKTQRVVYLPDRAMEVANRLSLSHPSGPIFRNTGGRPWNMSSVKCRFQNLRVTLGRQKLRELGLIPPKVSRLAEADRAEHEAAVVERRREIKALARQHGPRYNLYALRHSFITQALLQGVDAVTVSVLVGHRDTTMMSRHYAHLTERQDHLIAAARRARGS